MDRVQHCEQFLMFFPQNANLHSLRLGVWVLDPRGVPKQKHNTIDTGCCFARHQALSSLPENDTVGPVLIQIDVLCSRFVNAIELGKNTLIFSEFAW